MTRTNEQSPGTGYQPKGRPQSTIALDFSAALDGLFKLNGIGALEESVEQKKENVLSQQSELEELDTKLRETDAKLRRLESKHRRQKSQQILPQRKPVASSKSDAPGNETEEDSSGDSDIPQSLSPQQHRGQQNR